MRSPAASALENVSLRIRVLPPSNSSGPPLQSFSRAPCRLASSPSEGIAFPYLSPYLPAVLGHGGFVDKLKTSKHQIQAGVVERRLLEGLRRNEPTRGSGVGRSQLFVDQT